MKILYVTDLHGKTWKYERLFEAARDFKADAVINGGDMLPNDDPFGQGEFITNHLDGHFARFDSAGIYYLCCLGNDDLRIFDPLFEETCSRYPFTVNLAQRKFCIEGYEFVGMNWVVDYPFQLKDRCRMDTGDYLFQRQSRKGLLSTPNGWQEIDGWIVYARTLPTIEEELDRLPRPGDMAKSVYVTHMPPYTIGLDRCYHGEEVGSRAVHSFLEKHQPLLSLHGHIHESPDVTGIWCTKLGNTVCIQPGQARPSELTYVTIDLSTMESERVKERRIA